MLEKGVGEGYRLGAFKSS